MESGHHTEMWLDLDRLFARPAALRPYVAELGRRVSARRIDAVCGPLSGGAFLAQLIAADLGVGFAFAERIVTERTGLFPVDYRIVPALRGVLRDKRVAIVDDAISAGSAVRGTVADVKACAALPVVLGALISFGSRAREIAADERIPLESLVQLPNPIWAPTECPMCALGAPLQTP